MDLPQRQVELETQSQHDDLIKKAQSGDHAAFGQLYLLFKKRVHSICFRIVKNNDEADDLTQDAFINAFKHINSFRQDSRFSTWITRIAINVCLMHLRKNKNGKVLSLDELIELKDGSLQWQIASVDRRQASTLERLSFMKAFKGLRKDKQFLIYAFDIQGCEQDEIAAMLGISTLSLKSKIHRARNELRTRLGFREDEALPVFFREK
jgi:RNA polymerase sigma-70 factor, ECF subfamily